MWCKTLLNQTGKITTIIFYFFKTGSLKNMESVGDLRLILELPGHQSIKTTIRYTHTSQKNLANIPSPFDDPDID